MSERVLLDPTGEREAPSRERAPRPASLDGRTIGLLDISKPAPIDLRHEIGTQCDVVIEALAD